MSSASARGGEAQGGGGPSSSATAGSATQQANAMTRNFILGVPKEGLNPNSEEAAQLHAAEVFVNDIQQEILAYDVANAQAMELAARRAWSRVPFFGRRAKAALEAEAAVQEARVVAEAAELARRNGQEGSGVAGEAAEAQGGLAGLDAVKAAEAAAAAAGGSTFLHTQKGQTMRGGFQVERTSAVDAAYLQELAQKQGKLTAAEAQAQARLAKGKAPGAAMNAWLFKKKHPAWTPLMQRWWVPWLCLSALVLVWTPDVWKLRTLYYLDWQYSLLRQGVHKTYWRLTMKKEDYDALIADIEAQRPTTVKATDCPF